MTMITVPWGTPAAQLILKEEIDSEELELRITYYHKQSLKWVEVSNEIAFADKGIEKYAYGMEQAQTWKRHARDLESLRE